MVSVLRVLDQMQLMRKVRVQDIDVSVAAFFFHFRMHHEYDCTSRAVQSENPSQIAVYGLMDGIAKHQYAALSHLYFKANLHFACTR